MTIYVYLSSEFSFNKFTIVVNRSSDLADSRSR